MESRLCGSHALRPLLSWGRRLLLIAMLAGPIGAASPANAATYYLNTQTGADENPGTADRPWRTLTPVQSGARAGDTVVFQYADAATYAQPWPARVSYQARVLRQFEITWTFDTDYPVGQFANRDLWVVGPVKIVEIDPPSRADGTGRVSNGAMVNPKAGYHPQGYDSSMLNNPYDATLNVAFNRSAQNPLVLPADSSLVSTVSVAQARVEPQLQRAAILTVLRAAAPEGSFRPPYCGADKTVRFNKSALDYSLLQKLPPVAATPALRDVEAQFAAPWLDHRAGWTGRTQHPKLNMPDYGREMHTALGTAALMLHLNFPDPQKEKLLCAYVQVGIDFYGIVHDDGRGNWENCGGHAGGRKWPILFAGIMLHDPSMKSIGAKSGAYLYQTPYGPGHCPPDYIHFAEDDQTFYVAPADVAVTNGPSFAPDARDEQKIPYSAADLGLPEWGIGHASEPFKSNKWFPTIYRSVAGPPFHATALAALLTPGGKAAWNHNAYFDYCDRYMQMTARGGPNPGWRSMSAFTANMWDTYRARCGPIWPAGDSGAPVLLPISDQQIATGQTLTLVVRSAAADRADLVYSASALPPGASFSGQTFTWTPSAAQTGRYQVTFTISAGKAQTSQTVTLTVTKPNSAPILGTSAPTGRTEVVCCQAVGANGSRISNVAP